MSCHAAALRGGRASFGRRSSSSRGCRSRTRSSAQALAALGRGREADAAFEEYFEQDPTRVRSRSRSITCARAARTRPSRRLRAALRENPDNVDALRCLAQVYWGDEERLSRRRGAAAPARRPWHRTMLPPGCCSAGCCTTPGDSRGRDCAATGACRRIEPGNAAGWTGLGADYAHSATSRQSATPTSDAVALEPDLPGIHMGYATC